MSEYLGSAFASFVGNRKATIPATASSQSAVQEPQSQLPAPKPLPFTPLPIPNPTPPSQKRLRYSQLPTVLIPESFAPVPLVSPVSILAGPACSAQSFSVTPTHNSSHASTLQAPTPTSHAPASHTPLPTHPTHRAPNRPDSSAQFVQQPSPQLTLTSSHTLRNDRTALQPAPINDFIPARPAVNSLKRPREQPSHPTAEEENARRTVRHRGVGRPIVGCSSNFPYQLHGSSEDSQVLCCTHCKARFEEHESLLLHVKQVHQRPFSCMIAGCTACFSKQNHLSRHIRIVHNKERPFACDEPGCGSRFGSKSHLGDHTRAVHMRLRNFKCNICNASWSKRFNLEKHIRIRHLGEKPFKCTTCNLSFGTRSHVTRHEVKVHKRVEGGSISKML